MLLHWGHLRNTAVEFLIHSRVLDLNSTSKQSDRQEWLYTVTGKTFAYQALAQMHAAEEHAAVSARERERERARERERERAGELV